MRLLRRRDDGSFELTQYLAERKDQLPPYAILSHTWLTDASEVDIQDIRSCTSHEKTESYKKLEFCANQTSNDKLEYFWIDTCCIDPENAAELQEAITRMYQWYHKATKCYAYLSDVSVTREEAVRSSSPLSWERVFKDSRYFTRGWTLQELLAPTSVEFFSREGTLLGSRETLRQWIHEITRIPDAALQGEPLANFTYVERMSWANKRATRRPEDKAYSLLGIFGVSLLPNYGEGEHAFVRLKEEINKNDAEKVKLDELLEKLPTSPDAPYNSRGNQYEPFCLANTRVELLEEVRRWAYGSTNSCIYWLNGIAGTGKSTIARTVANEYHKVGMLGASFFFSKGGGDASQAGKLFTTLAWQLAENVPSLKRHICEAIRKHKDVAQKSLRDQWEELILKPLANLEREAPQPTILLVIDALDECNSDQDIDIILRLLAMAKKLEDLQLKVFITSRPDTQVRYSFEAIPAAERHGFVLHEIRADLIDRDLKIFFEDNLSRIAKQRGLDSKWPSPQVIDQLVEVAYGLFIWASTACMYIKQGKAAAKERTSKLIKGQPSGSGPHKHLDQLYITVLNDAIHQGHFDEDEKSGILARLKRILGTIVTLHSRLSVRALANLLDIDLEVIRDSLADLHTILNIPADNDRPIRLHHPTFRDFLLDKDRCNNLDFWIDATEANQALAEQCIQLMSKTLRQNICRLSSSGGRVARTDEEIKQYIPAELGYACLQWAEHCRRGKVRLEDNDSVHRFFKLHFLHWVEVLSLLGKSSEMTAIIRLYQSLLRPGLNKAQVPFVKDSRRLMFTYHSRILDTPLQLYAAAIVYIRPSNELRHHFWHHIHKSLKHVQIVQAEAPEEKDEYNYVNDLAFTPDGRKIASGSLDEWARVWDVRTLSEHAKLEGQSDKISSVAISPDGELIASGSDDFTVMVWTMEPKERRYTITAHARWVNSVTFSPDGRFLASGSMDETVRLWDAVTGAPVETIEPKLSGINSIAFSPDSRLLAMAAVDPIIHLYDLAKQRADIKLDGHSGPVNCVSFSRDGKRLVSGSDDMTVRLWNSMTGSQIMRLDSHEEKVWCVVFAYGMPMVASGSEDKTIKLWSADTGDLLSTLRGHTSGICAVAFSPDDQKLAAAAFNDEVRFWQAKTGREVGKLTDFEEDTKPSEDPDELAAQRGHSEQVNCLVFAHDGQRIASGSLDNSIKIWTNIGQEVASMQDHSGGINYLEFSPSSQFLASASVDETAKIWEAGSGKLLHTLAGHSGSVRLARYSSDERVIASCSTDKTIILWDPLAGAVRKTLHGHVDTVHDIAFTPDNKILVSCSADASICLWGVESGQMMRDPIIAHDGSVNSVALSADGTLIVSSSSDKLVKVWDLDGKLCAALKGHTLPVNSAAFAPNSKRIVSCSDDETIRIWNLDTREETNRRHVGAAVRCVSFAGNGQYIMTNRGLLDICSEPISPATDFWPTTDSVSKSSAHDSKLGVSDNETEGTQDPKLEYLEGEGNCKLESNGDDDDNNNNNIDSTKDHRTTYGFTKNEEALDGFEHLVFVTEEWVTRDMEDVLWLPEEYRAQSVAIWDDTVVLGHVSGALSFLRM